jgi:hypothetical protein
LTVAVVINAGCGRVVQWRLVEEGSPPGRVEIELTAREGRRGRRRSPDLLDPLASEGPLTAPAHDGHTLIDPVDSAYAAPLEEPGGRFTDERRRLLVTALVSGVIALFVGWSLGRAGDGDGSTSGGTPTDSASVTTTVAPELVGAPVPSVDPELLPTTSAFTPIVRTGRRPPSTSAPFVGWTTTTADVSDAATTLGVRIVGLEPDGTVVELDTTTGEMSRSQTSIRTNNPGALFAGADWIVVSQPDSARAELLRGHGDPEIVTLAPAWLLYWQRGTDRFWRLEEVSRFGDPLHIAEINYDGTPTGVEFESDGRYWMAGADPLGGLLLLGAPGGSYRIAPEGTSRITTGDVIAISADKALATDCGEAMDDCGLIVIDRTTGAVAPLAPAAPAHDTTSPPIEVFDNPANYGFPSVMSTISPDGRYAPIMVLDTGQDYGVIDLTTGDFIRLGDQPVSSLWWSPDSRSVMYLSNGHLLLYDFDTGASDEVSTDFSRLHDFAVRPPIQ